MPALVAKWRRRGLRGKLLPRDRILQDDERVPASVEGVDKQGGYDVRDEGGLAVAEEGECSGDEAYGGWGVHVHEEHGDGGVTREGQTDAGEE